MKNLHIDDSAQNHGQVSQWVRSLPDATGTVKLTFA
jgi:hypothetical protein